MFIRNKSNNDKKNGPRKDAADSEISFSSVLETNLQIIKTLFNKDDTLAFRRFKNQQAPDVECCIVFIDGVVKPETVDQNIIQPIVTNLLLENNSNCLNALQYQVLISDHVEQTSEVPKVVEAIINGNTALFLDGVDQALTINSAGWKTRSVEEPQGEKVLRGPREGFTESVLTNLSLIRRRLKTANLKFQARAFGRQSNTKAYLCYIEGIANPQILDELNKRLDAVDLDAVLDSGYIQELIKDSPLSPFKTIGSTERPDVVAAKLLEGRIALLIDGTPVALTLPHVFIELFQVNEDYYVNFYYSSFNRILRIISFWISISLPAVYLALVTYHQELVPTPLIISISAARQGIPFPSLLEAILLIIVFEIIREAGTRMPSYIGQALSIVGGLVIGQAAVQAKFVSAPIIIIVAMTGITGLMIAKLKGATIVLRFILLLLASILGLYGYIFGISGLLIHLFQLRSFGVPYMTGMMTIDPDDLKDITIRSPWWYMKRRPKFIGKNNPIRQNTEEGS